MSLQANIRTTIRGVVLTLSSADEMLHYSTAVPDVNVIAEVYCQWFDDIYFPEDEQFRCAFSPEALSALAELNAHLLAVENLVEGLNLRDLLGKSWWTKVQLAAQTALSQLPNSAQNPE